MIDRNKSLTIYKITKYIDFLCQEISRRQGLITYKNLTDYIFIHKEYFVYQLLFDLNQTSILNIDVYKKIISYLSFLYKSGEFMPVLEKYIYFPNSITLTSTFFISGIQKFITNYNNFSSFKKSILIKNILY